VGPALDDVVHLELPVPRRLDDGDWEAPVVHVDHFGNVLVELGRATLTAALASVGDDPTALVVRAGGRPLPLVHTYADVAAGEACALVGSSGRLEIAVNQGDAARELGLAPGDLVRLCRLPSGSGGF
jgi:hypothetical protein